MKGKEFALAKIHEKKVVVFSKTWCGFCRTAKKVLAQFGLGNDVYEVVEIDERDDCTEIQDYMRELTGASSVPRVFINGNCIGGGQETAALDRSGKLSLMLREAGAIQ